MYDFYQKWSWKLSVYFLSFHSFHLFMTYLSMCFTCLKIEVLLPFFTFTCINGYKIKIMNHSIFTTNSFFPIISKSQNYCYEKNTLEISGLSALRTSPMLHIWSLYYKRFICIQSYILIYLCVSLYGRKDFLLVWYTKQMVISICHTAFHFLLQSVSYIYLFSSAQSFSLWLFLQIIFFSLRAITLELKSFLNAWC